jgi:glycerol-3-phosphate dehydrogenase subunit B
MRSELHFDAVVIGGGMAGLTAGTRLAQAGAKVAVLAKGNGSTHLAPGTIDVLGYTPERVSSPSEALAKLISERPDHPYALTGIDAITESLSWFAECVSDGPLPGYSYVGGLERNTLLPTAMGVLRPSALIPATMAGGDSTQLGTVAIVGLPALREFHPTLCAANLSAAGIAARGINLQLPVERADMSPVGMARHFDDAARRAQFCAQLLPLLRHEQHVGLPAMLGFHDPAAVVADLERRLGRGVFEIPTLPPSVPGMRRYEILRAALRAAGGRLVLGAEVISHERSGSRVASVATHAAGRDLTYVADSYVLASGGFASGAIELDSHWVTHERVLGLPLRGVPESGEPRFTETYLSEQPMARAGVAVDDDLRASGVDNVLVAGASLPGATPWREGSGEGIALASGYRAAAVIAGGLSSSKAQEGVAS